VQLPTVLKFGMLEHYGSPREAELRKSTSGQIQDVGRRQKIGL